MRPSGNALPAPDLLQERRHCFRFAVCQPVTALSPACRTLLFRVRGLSVRCRVLEKIARPSIVLIAHGSTVSSDNKNSVSSDAVSGKPDRAPRVQGPPSLMVDFCPTVARFGVFCMLDFCLTMRLKTLPRTPSQKRRQTPRADPLTRPSGLLALLHFDG